MSDVQLDELDHKILKILARKKRRTADEIYFEISGFPKGKFGRSVINLKLLKLSKLGHISAEPLHARDSKDFVYSIRKGKQASSQ